MEVEYKREMNRNYMILRPEPGHVDRYTIRMISGNQIAGLLPFLEKWMDGENRYYFDITSKQPLGRLLEYRTITGDEIYSFLSGFLYAVRQVERFLLDENQICLDPEYLYVEPDSFQCALLMIPGQYADFTCGFRALCSYLLDHVNRNDGNAVLLAFSVFKESQKENFGMDDIAGCLEKRGKQSTQPENNVSDPRECRPAPVIDTEEVQEESEKTEEKHCLPKMTGAILGVFMLIVPVMMLLIVGWDFVVRFKWHLIGMEGLLGLVIMLLASDSREQKKEPAWEEDVATLLESVPIETKESENSGEMVEVADMKKEHVQEECFQTVLLTAKPVGGKYRYLVPAGGGEEIPIHYFPFLIGKNKGVVDLYLNENGISRLHAKLEESDGQYYVTDLNSTNGIMVDGVWLEANERKALPIGSELILAASRFYFR